ncbi:ubiA prenyltransferase family [Artemisia annua]|uniref:UbiA prenyltransferase family n=1 Tax=Artemisia annua TaxID=35608 RepID=A0A2U1Q0H9_ARTAN|nr:ubiA prenyltransferase family [Artemisia annua]
MKSMQIESALKPSSLLSRLGPTAVVSRHEEGGVSCINVRKPVRLEHSSAKFSMLNTPQKANIYVAKVRRPESKFLTNAFSESLENVPESRFFRPQITRESILTMLAVIYNGVFANLYVAGFNQLSDIEIDKLGLFLWYAVGTVYSVNLPFLRWKRFPVLAALCIWSFQGAIVPILFHLHAQTSIPGRTILLSKHAIFVSAFMSVHAIVNALLKDIPDVEGDKINGVDSFALQFGQKRVIGHGIFGFTLWKKANLVDLDSKEATESFYLFIWKNTYWCPFYDFKHEELKKLKAFLNFV